MGRPETNGQTLRFLGRRRLRSARPGRALVGAFAIGSSRIERGRPRRSSAHWLLEDTAARPVGTACRFRGLRPPRNSSAAPINRSRSPFQAARSSPLSNIPIRVPRHFLGRDDAIEAIDAALKQDEGRVAITALHGLRGVGKTTLAAAYAERRRADYRATWWIRAQTESTMRADLVALGVRLGWVAADEKEEPALAAVRERLRDEGEGLLLIYDNAIDAASLRPYLPPGGAARVLVTSNAHAWRGDRGPGRNPRLAQASRRRLPHRPHRARKRARRRGGAVGGARRPAARPRTGGGLLRAARYVARRISQEVRRRAGAAARRREKDAPAEYHDGLTVAKTFALAIEEAAKLHPAAEPLDRPRRAARARADPAVPVLRGAGEIRRAAGVAARGRRARRGGRGAAGLRARRSRDDSRRARSGDRDGDDPAASAGARRWRRGGCRREAAEAARRVLIEAMAAVYPATVFNDPSAWPRARRLDALALDLVGGAGAAAERRGRERRAFSCDALGVISAWRRSRPMPQARPLLERALAIREKVLGAEHPDTAHEPQQPRRPA